MVGKTVSHYRILEKLVECFPLNIAASSIVPSTLNCSNRDSGPSLRDMQLLDRGSDSWNRVHQPPLKVAYKALKASSDVRLRHVDVIALRYAR